MDGRDFQRRGADHRLSPLAAAVTLALAGALAGCATHNPPPNASEVEKAKAAFAQQNYGDAARLLAEPAMKGDAEAQYALGYLYYYGQGVPQDHYRARRWFETSAKLGNRDARRALATLTTYGKLPRMGEAAPAPASESATAQPAPVQPAVARSDPPSPAPAPVAATPVTEPVAESAPAPQPAAETSAQTTVPAPVTPTPVAPPAMTAAPEAPAPAEVAPAAESRPAAPASEHPVAPVVLPKESPRSGSATAQDEAATAPAPVAGSVPSPITARAATPAAVQCLPAGTPGEATAASAPLPEKAPERAEPPAAVATEEAAAGPHAAALRRPATDPVTLVPGSEQAAPILRRKPAPVTTKGRYTIHLLSSPSKEELFRTVRTFGLAEAAWYPVQQPGGVQYRLIYGGYDTLAEAQAALRGLPEALYARNPWVNNYPASVTVTAFNGTPTARVAAVAPDVLR